MKLSFSKGSFPPSTRKHENGVYKNFHSGERFLAGSAQAIRKERVAYSNGSTKVDLGTGP